ncbi:YqzK family protein [Bacillus sp. T3]|uniref:YqzK family protein n=1 Tax=Bacillus sp. T3 TaxID=467262 RepID=UPI0029829E4D|nr:YqzK family protein [Bacillus sp. T3]
MKAWFKLVFRSIKVFILFVGCTILFYYGMMWVNEEYQNYHRYDEPQGTALKVSAPVEGQSMPWLDRLILFYLNGE